MSSGHGSRRKKHEEHEEHENHERWLVSYADMVTLLMVLFVVMFAMSQVDEKKYAQLKEGLAAGFGSSDSLLEGSSSLHEQPGSAAVDSVSPQLATANLDSEQRQVVANAVQQAAALQNQRSWDEAAAEAERLEKVRATLTEALEREGLAGDVATSYDHRGLVISLVSRHVVFQANLASLSLRGQQVVDAVAPVLRSLEDPLQIDGHTNQVPVKPKYYATDGDRSAARAVTGLRRLEEQHGLPTARLSMAGYGSTRPLVDPSKPGAQAVNKRVDIVVLTDLAPQDAALLPDAAAKQEADAAIAQEKATGKAQKKARTKAEKKAARKAKKAEQAETDDTHDSDTDETDSPDTDGAHAAAGRIAPDPKEQS